MYGNGHEERFENLTETRKVPVCFTHRTYYAEKSISAQEEGRKSVQEEKRISDQEERWISAPRKGKKCLSFFDQKLQFSYPRASLKDVQATRRSLQPSKENIQHFNV
jgi:hypothetical protein